ncbi:MAG: tripartite tricarboxylate transporter permease [Defluviitaleaceae bacterium]|nr:tripartite tricarboxylate transporter permease [Defluviitaleaceae bacterium]
MELLRNLFDGTVLMMGFMPLLMIFIGVAVGIVLGTIPGISTSMAVALLLPFTFTMNPLYGMALLLGCYKGGNYSGCIPAVTINTPGTPSSVPTLFDGYPMAKSGRGGEALGILLWSSFVGGIFGTLVLVLFATPMARWALNFWSAEYFALCVLGLASVATLGGKHWQKALIAVLFGLLLNTMGTDPLLGTQRYTFGLIRLFDGFHLMPILIGLFALGELFHNLENYKTSDQKHEKHTYTYPKLLYYWKLKWEMLRASVVGTLVGILPGAGSAIASFLAYDLEKRVSKNSANFGKGAPEGVAASGASDSANTGGSLVPMLALGIPGAPTVAVLMSALMIHGINPGPEMFRDQPTLVYGMFASMFIASTFVLFIGWAGLRVWVRTTNVKKPILYTFIFLFTIIGSFAIRNSMFDVGVCIAFGLIGWIFKRFGYPVAPVVLGVVLGRIMEMNFRRAIMRDGAAGFYTRPLALIFLILAVAAIVYPFIQQYRAERKAKLITEDKRE